VRNEVENGRGSSRLRPSDRREILPYGHARNKRARRVGALAAAGGAVSPREELLLSKGVSPKIQE
jgi:hypothetical protein